MNNKLLSTCSIAAIAALSSAACAQDFSLKLSGDAKFQAMYVDEQHDDNSRSTDFRNRFRLIVNPEAKGADGALTYGAWVRLLAANNDATVSYQRSHMYLTTQFGTLLLGGVGTYSLDRTGRGDTGIQRPSDWQAEDDDLVQFVNLSQAKVTGTSTAVYGGGTTQLQAYRDKELSIGSSGSTSIRYTSPSIGGTRFAVGYLPSSSASGWEIGRSETATYQDAVDLALHFRSSEKDIASHFGNAYVEALASYQFAGNGVANHKDWRGWQGGLILGYENFRIGGAYLTYGKSNTYTLDANPTDRYGINLGAQYKFGDYTVGVGYNYTQRDVNYSASAAGKKTTDIYSTGIRTDPLKGVRLYLNYSYIVVKNTNSAAPVSSDHASMVSVATQISF